MGITLTLSLLLLGWAEVSTFIYISNEIGGVLTLLGIFITAFVGIVLLKNQGLSVLKRIRSNMLEGRASVSSVADSISLVIGGILMLIPGYFSDAVGLLLFVPGLKILLTLCTNQNTSTAPTLVEKKILLKKKKCPITPKLLTILSREIL